MLFEPDIIVDRGAGGVALVVDVKLREPRLPDTEQGLKRYMSRRRCPTGMIVFPDRVRIYRDAFVSLDADSVQLVGEYKLPPIFPFDSTGNSEVWNAFEDAVQAWVERLATPSALDQLSGELRSAIEDHVVPAILQGEVRAARPRPRGTLRAG